MMYASKLSLALARRERRRANVNVHKRSPRMDSMLQGATSGYSGSELSFLTSTSNSGRTSYSSGFDANDGNGFQYLPVAIEYLAQVTLKLSVTKRHTDVRYVITVWHNELHLAWRHARSFDEYRKLQQRLLNKLQHGHFCDADCPWLYGFLKGYFPKKYLFTVSSTRVVERRRQTLENFFAALYGFLTKRKNFCCSVIMTVVANELVEFIYGDALQQFGLKNPIKSTVLEMDMLRSNERHCAEWKEPAEPLKLHLLECDSEKQQQQRYSRSSSLTNSMRDSIENGNGVHDSYRGDCGICGSPLCGVAHGSSASMSDLMPVVSQESNTNRVASSTETNVISSNNTRSMSAPPLLNTPTKNCSGGSSSANTFGNPRRSRSSSANTFGNPRRSRSSSANRRLAAMFYLTTLSCSHQFHDECIVPKLNEALKCPTCGREQTKR